MSLFGLPSLPPSVNLITDIVFAVADAVGIFSIFSSNQWGIFQDREMVINPDNLISVASTQDWTMADFNIEEGGFDTYDKVDTPFTNRVRMSSGGSQANRQALLDEIDAIAGNLELYDVVTPERVWSNVNFQGYELVRTSSNGAGMIIIDIVLNEIREDAGTTFTNTKSPTATSPKDNGTVQSSSSSSSLTDFGPVQ